MAKNDLIGGSLWEQYSAKVSERMNDPRHRGEISEEEARALGARLVVADWGAESCGDAVRLYWAVDPKTDRILLAKFKSFGCGTAIASSDMMAELSLGKTVDEAMKITNIEVERSLRDDDGTPAIPPQKMHCSVMAYDVIKKAASIYKGVDIASLAEEDIVCECARVSLRTIQDVIRINDLKTVEEITQYTKAGAFCKSCIRPGGHEKRTHYLVDILRDTRAAMDRDQLALQAEARDFASMNLIQKHRAIEKALDEKIRPALAADGGSLEVVDIREAEGTAHVYIRYLGACRGCISSTRGTLQFIENMLHQELSASIRVIPL
ncbi:MAG: iron-sulfur cluster assembly scaffold protein [Acidobacteria bacterium]|jgi:NifU-like protein|nr:iron-sulfur cluster assembly scaffold protein [Acidobacteriota bacterium]